MPTPLYKLEHELQITTLNWIQKKGKGRGIKTDERTTHESMIIHIIINMLYAHLCVLHKYAFYVIAFKTLQIQIHIPIPETLK